MLKKAEDAHFAIHGTYGTTDELMKDGTINAAFQGKSNYTVDVTVLEDGGKYVAMSVPVEYGPTGRRSFLLDLAALSGLPRVVAFLGVGALLLLIGYLAPLPPAISPDRESSAR